MSTSIPHPAAPAESTVTTESDVQQIRDLVDAWCRATEACDVEAIKPLMDEDILFLTAGHEPFGVDTFIHRFTNNVQQLCPQVRAEVREIEVREDLAFARTWLEVRITPVGSEQITRTGYTLAIYRKRPGGPWKLWRDANLV
jgi:uncharacterized protein (TIGR02246 family)